MRGRKPKDSGLKLLEGTVRKDRPTRESHQPPPADLGSPPEWIKGLALWAWRHFAVTLAPKGRKTIDRRHRKKLELLCKTYELWRGAVKSVDETGRTVVLYNSEGQPVNVCKNPDVVIELAAAKEVRLLLAEFNTSARAAAAVPDEDDELERLLGRGKTR